MAAFLISSIFAIKSSFYRARARRSVWVGELPVLANRRFNSITCFRRSNNSYYLLFNLASRSCPSENYDSSIASLNLSSYYRAFVFSWFSSFSSFINQGGTSMILVLYLRFSSYDFSRREAKSVGLFIFILEGFTINKLILSLLNSDSRRTV